MFMKRSFFVFSLVFSLVLTGCGAPVIEPGDEIGDDEEVVVEEQGEVLKLTGHVARLDRYEGFCDPATDPDCAIFEYAFFRIDREASALDADFAAYLEQMGTSGNAYFGKDAVGLGCVENGGLYVEEFQGSGNETVKRRHEVEAQMAAQLLASTALRPVTVTLHERAVEKEGIGTDCYSAYVVESVEMAASSAQERPEYSKPLAENFEEGGYVDVRGYAEVDQVDESFCEPETMECAKYDYVTLHIVSSDFDNAALVHFTAQNEGNSFVGEGMVGLGCVEAGEIYFENDSDFDHFGQYRLAGDLSAKILASTKEAPVDLRLVKFAQEGGRGAPACYSHFTDVMAL